MRFVRCRSSECVQRSPRNRCAGELVDHLAQKRRAVGGEAAAAADDAADHRLRLLVDVEADPVVRADHARQQVLLLVQEQDVAGRRTDLRREQRLDDAHERIGVEERVAVDRHDEVDVVVEEVLRRVVQRLALAGVRRELVQADRQFGARARAGALHAVRRAVVDHDHLLRALGGEHRPDRLLDELRVLVVTRDQHGDLLAAVCLVAAGSHVVRRAAARTGTRCRRRARRRTRA